MAQIRYCELVYRTEVNHGGKWGIERNQRRCDTDCLVGEGGG